MFAWNLDVFCNCDCTWVWEKDWRALVYVDCWSLCLFLFFCFRFRLSVIQVEYVVVVVAVWVRQRPGCEYLFVIFCICACICICDSSWVCGGGGVGAAEGRVWLWVRAVPPRGVTCRGRYAHQAPPHTHQTNHQYLYFMPHVGGNMPTTNTNTTYPPYPSIPTIYTGGDTPTKHHHHIPTILTIPTKPNFTPVWVFLSHVTCKGRYAHHHHNIPTIQTDHNFISMISMLTRSFLSRISVPMPTSSSAWVCWHPVWILVTCHQPTTTTGTTSTTTRVAQPKSAQLSQFNQQQLYGLDWDMSKVKWEQGDDIDWFDDDSDTDGFHAAEWGEKVKRLKGGMSIGEYSNIFQFWKLFHIGYIWIGFLVTFR